MRIAKVREANRKPVRRNSSQSVAFKKSTRAIQVTSEPWGSRSTQASLVASNAGERPPTSLNAGSIAKRPEWKTVLLSTHFGHVRPNATLTFFAVAETLVDSSRRHSRTHPDGDGIRPYGVARCGAKTTVPTKLPAASWTKSTLALPTLAKTDDRLPKIA